VAKKPFHIKINLGVLPDGLNVGAHCQQRAAHAVGMELLANIVIRPSRVHYHLNELGPVSFVVGDTRVSRIDLAVKSKNGVVLAASHYVPEGVPVAEMPVIVYCHGNGSSRFEALGCLDNVLPLKMSLFCFDFSGAGLSGARAHAPPAPRLLPSLMDDLFLTKQAGKIAPWEYGRAATWKACWTSCTRRVTGPLDSGDGARGPRPVCWPRRGATLWSMRSSWTLASCR